VATEPFDLGLAWRSSLYMKDAERIRKIYAIPVEVVIRIPDSDEPVAPTSTVRVEPRKEGSPSWSN
jgi:hypothetical protein